jgi:Cys-rich four helix bundle protein (predicted Tat secretion target)
MERRDLIQNLGLLGLGALTAQAMAAETGKTKAAAADAHHHHHHAASAPAKAVIAAATDCMVKGETCLAHCLVLLGEGDKEMAACARSVSQMLPVCTTLQKLAIQDSKYLKSYAALAAQICEDCEKECRKHEKKHDECKACAESCAACLKECKALAAA